MNDADFLLQWTEELKVEIGTLSFQEDDIRKDFFGLTYDLAYCYYRAFMILEFAEQMNKGQLLFSEEVYKSKAHVDRISETVKIPILRQGYFNYLNRNLLIDGWSAFELCVTTFCEGITSEEEKNKLLRFQYREIIKCIKSVNLSEKENLDIEGKTVKEHLTHVPITRKTDFLFSKTKGYGRNIEKDKKFLLFLGKLRNTLHTNFIYYGNDFEFKFGHAHFKFENNKIVVWYDPFEPSPKLYFYLIGELKNIWKEIVKTIDFKDLIQYPDSQQ